MPSTGDWTIQRSGTDQVALTNTNFVGFVGIGRQRTTYAPVRVGHPSKLERLNAASALGPTPSGVSNGTSGSQTILSYENQGRHSLDRGFEQPLQPVPEGLSRAVRANHEEQPPQYE
jgi:hypothetical protein